MQFIRSVAERTLTYVSELPALDSITGCLASLRTLRHPPEAKLVPKYRFYLLNRYDDIIEVHITECDDAGAIEETAVSLLAEHEVAVAVEAWDGPVRVYRQSDYILT